MSILLAAEGLQQKQSSRCDQVIKFIVVDPKNQGSASDSPLNSINFLHLIIMVRQIEQDDGMFCSG